MEGLMVVTISFSKSPFAAKMDLISGTETAARFLLPFPLPLAQVRLNKAQPINPVSLPTTVFRRRVFAMVNSAPFRHACNSVIVLNVVVLASTYYNQASELQRPKHFNLH